MDLHLCFHVPLSFPLFNLPLSRLFSLSFSPPLSLCVSAYIYLSVSLSPSLCLLHLFLFSVSISLCVSLSFPRSVSPFGLATSLLSLPLLTSLSAGPGPPPGHPPVAGVMVLEPDEETPFPLSLPLLSPSSSSHSFVFFSSPACTWSHLRVRGTSLQGLGPGLPLSPPSWPHLLPCPSRAHNLSTVGRTPDVGRMGAATPRGKG